MPLALLALLGCLPATTVHAAPVAVYDTTELESAACDWGHYPPTACRLRRLLGDTFAAYQRRGGCYPDDHGDGGFVAHGRACPQPGCASATTWIHPDGRMVVAMRAGERLELYANDPILKTNLPKPIQKYLDTAATDGGPATVAWQPIAPREDPELCGSPEETARTERWRGSRAGTVCDAEFSSFEQPLAVTAEKAHFFEQAGGAPRKTYIVSGDLVLSDYRSKGPFVCAQYRSIAGKATTGWMQRADTIALSDRWEDRSTTQSPPMAAPPDWLTDAPTTFGDLQVRKTSTGIHVEVERFLAGHLCSVDSDLHPDAGRRFAGGDPEGCAATAALFHNGVFLWASPDCGGARANCTGAYTK